MITAAVSRFTRDEGLVDEFWADAAHAAALVAGTHTLDRSQDPIESAEWVCSFISRNASREAHVPVPGGAMLLAVAKYTLQHQAAVRAFRQMILTATANSRQRMAERRRAHGWVQAK
jgi:hypothetical protein